MIFWLRRYLKAIWGRLHVRAEIRRLLSQERAARGIPTERHNAGKRPLVPWNGRKIHK